MKQDIQTFLDYCRNSGKYSDATIDSYRRSLESWYSFIGDSSAEQIGMHDIEAYQVKLADRGMKLSSQAQRLIAVRMVFRYLKRRQGRMVLDYESIEVPTLQREQRIKFLTREEVLDMIALASTARDKAIIATFFSTGLRMTELRGLRRDQFMGKRTGDTLEVRIVGKGNHERIVFFSPQTIQLIYAQLEGHKDVFVFPYSAAWIAECVGDVGYRALDKHVWPHMLRHSFATDLLGQGVDIRHIQEFLGHRSITSTQVYAHVTDVQLRNIHKKVHNK